MAFLFHRKKDKTKSGTSTPNNLSVDPSNNQTDNQPLSGSKSQPGSPRSVNRTSINRSPSHESLQSYNQTNSQPKRQMSPLETLKFVEQSLKNSNLKSLGLTPDQVADALSKIDEQSTNQPNNQSVTQSVDQIVRLLKRYCYETVAFRASTNQTIEYLALLMDLLYPLMILLPDIDATDLSLNQLINQTNNQPNNQAAAQGWTYKPHVSNKQHKPVMKALFDDIIGDVIAMKFFTMLPRPDMDDSIDITSPQSYGQSNNQTVKQSNNQVVQSINQADSAAARTSIATFLTSLDELLGILHSIDLSVDQQVIKTKFCEFFHAYFKQSINRTIKPATMLPSEHLQAVKWLYNYTTQLENMIGDQSLNLSSELDVLVDSLMDAHEEASKARIIQWLSNILSNEQSIKPSVDDDGFYVTSGPQDLFININQLIDHSANQAIGDKALFRMNVMYAQCLLYYQECLKRFLAQLEVMETFEEQKEQTNSQGGYLTQSNNVQPVKPPIKPAPYLYAMINNSQAYDDDTEDFRLTCAQSFNQLSDQLLDDWDDLIDQVLDGWFDCAIAACDILVKRSIKPLLSDFAGLYHTVHVSNPSFFKQQLIKPISEAYSTISKSVNRPALVKHFIQSICVLLINQYTRAFLAGAGKQAGKGVNVVAVLDRDLMTINQFYHDWANYMPDEVLACKLALLTALQRLIGAPKLTITSAAPLIQAVRDALAADPIVPAYLVVHTVLSDIRRDVDSRDKTSMLIVFGEDEVRAAADVKLQRNVSLTDLSLTNTTVAYELSVTIDRARDLVIKDTVASDPYVMVYLFETSSSSKPLAVRRTKHINQSLNPVWGATFDDFSSKEASSFTSIVFEVWDRDMLNSEFMGKAELTVEQIRKQKLLSLTSPTLNVSGLPAMPSMTNDTVDKLTVTFTLPLKPREKSLRPGATPDDVKGDITVKIMYYSKPVPTSRPLLHANTMPTTSQPSATPSSQPAPITQNQSITQPAKTINTPSKPRPVMLDLSTDDIMKKLDTTPSMPSEAKQRSIFDRVMRKSGKRLVKDPAVAEAERKAQAAAIRKASAERERQEAEELAQRNKEIDVFQKNEIARLADRQGYGKVTRNFKPKRRWFGMKADSHAQMLKMREEQQRERKRRHEELMQQERMANAKDKAKKQQSMLTSMGAKLWG